MKEAIPGIRINYAFTKGKNYYSCEFYFVFDKKLHSNTLVYSRKEVNFDEIAGLMTLRFFPSSRTAEWTANSPLTYAEFLARKGIKNRLELAVMRKMKQKFPSLEKFSDKNAVPERIAQLQRRGITGTEYSFNEAVSKLSKKIKSDNAKKGNKIRLFLVHSADRKPRF
jgi:hypothetical protein